MLNLLDTNLAINNSLKRMHLSQAAAPCARTAQTNSAALSIVQQRVKNLSNNRAESTSLLTSDSLRAVAALVFVCWHLSTFHFDNIKSVHTFYAAHGSLKVCSFSGMQAHHDKSEAGTVQCADIKIHESYKNIVYLDISLRLIV